MNLISLFAYSTLLLQVVGGVLILLLLVRLILPKNKKSRLLATTVSKHAIIASFIVASIATLGSLYLSEVRSFTPCKLCWYQRIFMYPQVLIFGIGLMINDTKTRIYGLVLSIIGLGIALYHILVQFFPAVFQCSDEIANCSVRQFAIMGYITIPVMSATTFGLIIIVLLFTFLRNSR